MRSTFLSHEATIIQVLTVLARTHPTECLCRSHLASWLLGGTPWDNRHSRIGRTRDRNSCLPKTQCEVDPAVWNEKLEGIYMRSSVLGHHGGMHVPKHDPQPWQPEMLAHAVQTAVAFRLKAHALSATPLKQSLQNRSERKHEDGDRQRSRSQLLGHDMLPTILWLTPDQLRFCHESNGGAPHAREL